LFAAINQHANETPYELRFGHVSFGVDIMRRAQWKYPDDFWINHRLGTSLIWLGGEQTKEGLGFMRAAVAVRPENAHARSNLGNGYSFLGMHDEAIKCFRKGIELKPDYWNCWTNLGMSLARNGQFEEAINAFDEAIRITPELATEAYSELSIVLSCHPDAERRDLRRAAALANKGLQLEPSTSNLWTALGAAHFREGDWENARNALERSLTLNMDGTGGALRWDKAINWFFLAMTNWRAGQQDEARKCYDQAMQETNDGLRGQTDVELVQRLRAEADDLLNKSP
jgi:tetratricopeptide (TPR) repeat protein